MLGFCLNKRTLLKSEIHVCVFPMFCFCLFFWAPRLKPGTVLCLSVVGTSCLTLVFPPDEEECDAMSLFNTKKGKRIKFCSCFVSLSFIPAGLRLGLIGRLSAFWLLAAQRKSLRQRRLLEDGSLLLPALRHPGFQCFLHVLFPATTRHGLEWLHVHSRTL